MSVVAQALLQSLYSKKTMSTNFSRCSLSTGEYIANQMQTLNEVCAVAAFKGVFASHSEDRTEQQDVDSPTVYCLLHVF